MTRLNAFAHPKQNYSANASGTWGSVWIEVVSTLGHPVLIHRVPRAPSSSSDYSADSEWHAGRSLYAQSTPSNELIPSIFLLARLSSGPSSCATRAHEDVNRLLRSDGLPAQHVPVGTRHLAPRAFILRIRQHASSAMKACPHVLDGAAPDALARNSRAAAAHAQGPHGGVHLPGNGMLRGPLLLLPHPRSKASLYSAADCARPVGFGRRARALLVMYALAPRSGHVPANGSKYHVNLALAHRGSQSVNDAYDRIRILAFGSPRAVNER
ncbi:hypothetical protein DFH07DRAFT_777749 [Mycena maculata]|uniref:Uncharacterized protein n=1 Tax=Mycena maculata TaxID=230809 RepID=A0AAD7IG52_9AGAR|nr:hypothetical protein DFH07DRAFT_777749 [Mycena maculata]